MRRSTSTILCCLFSLCLLSNHQVHAAQKPDPQWTAYADLIQHVYDSIGRNNLDEARKAIQTIEADHASRTGWEFELVQSAIRNVRARGSVDLDLHPCIHAGPKTLGRSYAMLNHAKPQVVFAGDNGMLKVADLSSKDSSELMIEDPWIAPLTAARFSTNGKYCLTGNRAGKLTLWNAEDWSVAAKIDPSANQQMDLGLEDPSKEKDPGRAEILKMMQKSSAGPEISVLDVTDDGHRIAFNLGINAVLWDVPQNKLIAQLNRMGAMERGPIRFSHDDSLLVVGALMPINIYDGKTGAEINSIPQATHPMHVAFSPDNTLVASGTRGNITRRLNVYNVKSSEEVFEIPQQPSAFVGVEFLPDNQRVIAADSAGDIRILHVPSRATLLWISLGSPVTRMDVSNDGKILIWTRTSKEGTRTEYIDLNH